MGLFTERKPYTAISSEVESLLSHGPNSDPAKLLNLVELIQGSRPPETGAQEAGRVLRKRIKHGSPSEQGRALTLLETLVDNGIRTGALVVSSGLADQLTQFATSSSTTSSHTSHSKATRQCRSLLMDWSTRKDKNISSLASRAGLSHKADLRHKRRSFHPDDDLDAEVFGEEDSDSDRAPRSHSRSHSRKHSNSLSVNGNSSLGPLSSPPRASARSASRDLHPRSRSPSPLNLRGASLETTIATAHNIATRLTNALIASPGGSREVATYYRQAKQLRHRIIKLVHDPHSEVQEYIGQLLAANEELIAALQAHDAVLEDPESLATQDDHDPAAAALTGGRIASPGSPIEPVRPPPSPFHESSNSPWSASGGDLQAEPEAALASSADPFDPFGDDNEQLERPKHTPLW